MISRPLKTVFAVAVLALATALCGPVLADAPAGYYDSVDLSSQETIRTTLHDLIDDHTRYPYTSSSTDTWDILENADESADSSTQILDVYRNRLYTKFGGGNGPYNREHSWPNSYGFSSSGSTPYTDCHHLFLCDVGYNSARANYIYDDCASSCSAYVTDVNEGAGGADQPNYRGLSNGETVWQTWIGRRGDVARALLYMDVRYEGDSGEVDLVLTDDANLIVPTSSSPAYMGLLSTLIRWHSEDPVDAREMRRNDVVYSYQGNRNPFIDHPEWVSFLFEGVISAVDDQVPGMAEVVVRAHPNPFNPSTTIDLMLAEAGPVQVEVFSLQGRLVRTLLSESREAGSYRLPWDGRDEHGRTVASGAYFCRVQSGRAVDTEKLLLLK